MHSKVQIRDRMHFCTADPLLHKVVPVFSESSSIILFVQIGRGPLSTGTFEALLCEIFILAEGPDRFDCGKGRQSVRIALIIVLFVHMGFYLYRVPIVAGPT